MAAQANESRAASLTAIANARQVPEAQGAVVAIALVYLGDRIAELESPDLEQLAVEVGAIGTALDNLASEVAHLPRTEE